MKREHSSILSGERAGELQSFEVSWYRAHGRYGGLRIAREYRGGGAEYLIGDWSWNRAHPEQRELIEERVMEAFYSSRAFSVQEGRQ